MASQGDGIAWHGIARRRHRLAWQRCGIAKALFGMAVKRQTQALLSGEQARHRKATRSKARQWRCDACLGKG